MVLPESRKIDIISEEWTCQIENAMLNYILKREKVREQFESVAQMYDKSLAEEKEHFVSHIRLSIIDEDGDIVYDEGEAVVFTTKYQVTGEMMQNSSRR